MEPQLQLVECEATTLLKAGKSLHSGDQCPKCGQEKLDYDGLLNLSCPRCGYIAIGGGFS